LKTTLRYLISLSLAGAFLYWAFRGIDLASVWVATQTASPTWLVIIVATTLCTVAIRAWRWVILLKGVTRDVTVADATTALAICYTANIAFPRAGEAARALSLNWQRGVSVSATLGTVVVERILDMVFLLFFVGMSLALIPGRLEAAYPLLISGALVALLMSGVAILLLVFVCARGEEGVQLVHRWLSRALPGRIADLAADILRKFVTGLASVRGQGAYLKILASSLLLNAGYVLIIYESLHAFGLHLPPYDLGVAGSIVVMAISSIGVVMPIQGGIGTYHFFFANTLEVLYHVDAATALACATVVHALANATYLAIGIPALLIQRARVSRKAKNS
jgi:glycosyltransferase 2 family protein